MFWNYSKWQKIKQDAPGFNRGFFFSSKLWLLRIHKSCEIYRRMCTEKQVLVKIIYKGDKQGFTITNQCQTEFMEWKHTDSLVQKRFWVKQSLKKVMLTVFWDMKEPITIHFLVKCATVNRAFYYKLLWQNSPLLNDHRIYIFSWIGCYRYTASSVKQYQLNFLFSFLSLNSKRSIYFSSYSPFSTFKSFIADTLHGFLRQRSF